MTADEIAAAILLALLGGGTSANATRRNGRPCRVRLPDDPESRIALAVDHLRGAPATLTFHAQGSESWQESVEAGALAALCPGDDGRCRWVGVDLDAADHGEGGLADPVHATRVIAERAANAGLMSGTVVARSRRGRGRHVFLLLPEPVELTDAVIGVAALAAAAFKVAARDSAACETPHAFRCANGEIARPGNAGAVELVPRSTMKPRFGWPLALPGAGAFAARGGGVTVDPFTDHPLHLERVPQCDRRAWRCLVTEARATLSARAPASEPRPRMGAAPYWDGPRHSIDHIDARTQAFLDGRVSEGARNASAFAASANLLGCGIDEREAEQLILAGAAACGLSQREADTTFQSAVRTLSRKRGQT